MQCRSVSFFSSALLTLDDKEVWVTWSAVVAVCVLVFGRFIPAPAAANEPFVLKARRETIMLTSGALLSLAGDRASDRIPRAEPGHANPDDIFFLDRPVRNRYSDSAARWSDLTSHVAIVLPIAASGFSAMSEPDGAVQRVLTTGIMYTETMLFVQGSTNCAKAIVRRPRPYVYNEKASDKMRSGRGSRASMWSGHTAVSFAAAVFAGETMRAWWPDSWKTAAVAHGGLVLAAGTAALRVAAGRHFPTDVIAGAVVGSFWGWYIPYTHKNKSPRHDVTLVPSKRGVSLTFLW